MCYCDWFVTGDYITLLQEIWCVETVSAEQTQRQKQHVETREGTFVRDKADVCVGSATARTLTTVILIVVLLPGPLLR